MADEGGGGGSPSPGTRPLTKTTLLPGAETVTLEIFPEGLPSASISMTLEQLTDHIATMAKVRQAMVAGKPLQQLEGTNVEAIYDTRWYVQPSESPPGSVLTFYHPGFGPVAFVVPLPQVPQMVALLSSQVAAFITRLANIGASEEKHPP